MNKEILEELIFNINARAHIKYEKQEVSARLTLHFYTLYVTMLVERMNRNEQK